MKNIRKIIMISFMFLCFMTPSIFATDGNIISWNDMLDYFKEYLSEDISTYSGIDSFRQGFTNTNGFWFFTDGAPMEISINQSTTTKKNNFNSDYFYFMCSKSNTPNFRYDNPWKEWILECSTLFRIDVDNNTINTIGGSYYPEFDFPLNYYPEFSSLNFSDISVFEYILDTLTISASNFTFYSSTYGNRYYESWDPSEFPWNKPTSDGGSGDSLTWFEDLNFNSNRPPALLGDINTGYKNYIPNSDIDYKFYLEMGSDFINNETTFEIISYKINGVSGDKLNYSIDNSTVINFNLAENLSSSGDRSVYTYDVSFDKNFKDFYLANSGDNYFYRISLYQKRGGIPVNFGNTGFIYFNKNNPLNNYKFNQDEQSLIIQDSLINGSNYYPFGNAGLQNNGWLNGQDYSASLDASNYKNLIGSTNNFLSLFMDFTVFPAWLISLISFGILAGIICRIIGR